jgi:hypothetical protein
MTDCDGAIVAQGIDVCTGASVWSGGANRGSSTDMQLAIAFENEILFVHSSSELLLYQKILLIW